MMINLNHRLVLTGRVIKHESAGLNLVCTSEAPRRAHTATNKFSPYACAWTLNSFVLVIIEISYVSCNKTNKA